MRYILLLICLISPAMAQYNRQVDSLCATSNDKDKCMRNLINDQDLKPYDYSNLPNINLERTLKIPVVPYKSIKN